MGDPSSFFLPRTNCDSFHIMLNSLWGIYPYWKVLLNPSQNVISTHSARPLSLPYASCHALCRTPCLPMPNLYYACLMPCLPMPYALFLDCDSFYIMLNRGMPKRSWDSGSLSADR